MPDTDEKQRSLGEETADEPYSNLQELAGDEERLNDRKATVQQVAQFLCDHKKHMVAQPKSLE
jgi:hypothetical protein